jgi:pimeloyl-ACP methyl ester carboxylesterase
VVAAIEKLPAPVDPARVVLLGHSAGAQLTLCAGSHRYPVIGLAPLTDLDAAARDGVGWGSVTDLLGDPDRHPDRYRQASPAARLPLGVPQLFIHGLGDRHVPIAMTRSYVQAAGRTGDHAELVEVPDTDHFQIIDPEHASWATLLAALDSQV